MFSRYINDISVFSKNSYVMSDLMDDLLPYVECQMPPVGILQKILEKYNCSKRSVQRYIKIVKQA